MSRLHFAILTNNHRRAIDWLREVYADAVTVMKPTEGRGIVRIHNVARPFVIVHSDHDERLRGLELMGFEVLGPVRSRCIEVAKSRVRD